MATRGTMHRLGRGAARTGVALGLAAVLGVALAPAALANGLGAGPANFVSSVTAAPQGVSAQVLAADAYLAVAAEPGVTVEVPGYDGEPYLRFDADGTVHRNTRAPATYLNADRYGTDEIFEDLEGFDEQGVSAEAEPDWEQVADGGVYAWHDHRIHWMSPSTPPQVAGADEPQAMFDWQVPVTVDGADARIDGDLVWLPPASPVPWAAGLVVLAGAGTWAAVRYRGPGVAVGAASAAAVLGTALVALEVPERVAGMGLPAAAPAVPVAVAAVAVALAVPRRRRLMLLAAVVAAAAGGLAAGLRLPVLWSPVMPGWLDAALARPVVVVAVAAAVVGVVGAVAAYPSPRPDPDPEPGAGPEPEPEPDPDPAAPGQP